MSSTTSLAFFWPFYYATIEVISFFNTLMMVIAVDDHDDKFWDVKQHAYTDGGEKKFERKVQPVSRSTFPSFLLALLFDQCHEKKSCYRNSYKFVTLTLVPFTAIPIDFLSIFSIKIKNLIFGSFLCCRASTEVFRNIYDSSCYHQFKLIVFRSH